MQTGETVRLKILLCIFMLAVFSIACYSYRHKLVFNSIKAEITGEKVIEYGTESYDTLAMLTNVSGNVSVLKDIDTNVVGRQVVLFEIEKDNVIKQVPVEVEVVDSIAPTIELNNDVVYINSGVSYDVLSNIKSITDNVDKNFKYISSEIVTTSDVGYYTVNGSLNTNIVGTNTIEVKAVDSIGNVSIKTFSVIVTSNGKEQSIKNTAYSLLGIPYVYGGNNPSGFDCSGFVQYVYGVNGLKIGRSATDQYYNGYEVSYNNIRVGDIIVWGYGPDSITHTAIYVGNGLMIHASTPGEGVIINTVNGWGDYTNVHIVSIRRIS